MHRLAYWETSRSPFRNKAVIAGGVRTGTRPVTRAGRGVYQDRKETERFRRFTDEELAARDKLNLDIFWLKDDSLADIDSLPEPGVLAAEIVETLKAALEQFRSVAEELAPNPRPLE